MRLSDREPQKVTKTVRKTVLRGGGGGGWGVSICQTWVIIYHSCQFCCNLAIFYQFGPNLAIFYHSCQFRPWAVVADNC